MHHLMTAEEVSGEVRWWSAMGYPGGAPDLIARQGLERMFQRAYHQPSAEFFARNPDLAFDPTLFGELADHLKDTPEALPILGPPVSPTLREAGWALWRDLGVPGPLEYFIQHGLYAELKEALGGWEPQAVVHIFPEHADGVVLASVLWWHHALRGSDDVPEPQAQALRMISPLVHQFEIESALEAQQVKSALG